MAVQLQSHFHHCRPPPTPLMSYNTHSQWKTLTTRSKRADGSVQVSPIRNASHATRFCTRTGSGPLPVQIGRSPRGLTVFSGLGSIQQTTLQLLHQSTATTVVVSLLRAGLFTLTLAILISCIPSPKSNAFHQTLLRLSERGKITESSSNRLSVPKKFFSHFYILGSIWTTLLLVATWMYAYKTAPLVSSVSVMEHKYRIWNSVFLLLLMEAQVLRRLFESVYIFKYSPSARMHIVTYLSSFFYYIAAPLSLCCMFSLEVFEFVRNSFAEFVVKGMQVAQFDLWGHVNPLMQLNWCVWVGAAVFSLGWIHQHRCHAILGSLRDNKLKEDDYAIPHGDWFEYVSSPHYLAEIVIYGGLVIASGCSDITIWLLFGIVVANLTFTAAQTHKWYLCKFNNYPKSRYAIIPFIY